MLISKKVLIKKSCNKNLKYYTDLGYDTNLHEFEIDIKHLTKGSKYLIIAKCDFCGKEIIKPYYLYLKNISSNGLFACSNKCGKNKAIITNLEKYGVEYINQSENIREKTNKTNLEKYGFECATKSDLIKNKIKETNLERYGFESALQNKVVRDKIKETNLERYGVDHNFKSSEVRDKIRETLLYNWGVNNPSKSELIKEKKKETSIKNWGVDNPSKSELIKEKKRATCIENWEVEYPMQNKDIRDKSKKSLMNKYAVEHNSQVSELKNKMKLNNLQKWGVEYTLQSDEIKKNIKETNLKKYGSSTANQNNNFRFINYRISNNINYIKYIGNNISCFYCDVCKQEFEISSSNYYSRLRSNLPLCTVCNPIGNSQSIKEKELYEYIISVYTKKVIQSYRDGLEIDIYLPELKLGFEFNGLYWHSEEYKDKNYHLNKTNYFKHRDIRVIHIWEDDWDNKRDILKSQIKNWLGITENKIFARNCEVREISDSKTSTLFLNSNHIQGVDNSNIKLGLYFNKELVSIMTFNKKEGRKKLNDYDWNLSRFCNKLNTNIVGGASKILKHFIKVYNPSRIISYADKDWSNGSLYYKLGFKIVGESKPDYKYIIDNIRKNKQNYKKSNLKIIGLITENEYMRINGYQKIWDCGKIKFELV